MTRRRRSRRGWSPRGRILLPGEGVTGLAAAQGQAQFSNTSGIELDGTSVDPVDYSIVAAFPLCHDGTVLGVITLLFGRGAACPDSYLRLMDIIARLSAGAVFHSSLVDGGGDGPPSDDLTGLPSPRHLTRFFDQERIRSEQSGRPLALLVMDLDEFRKINDRFGHQGGDRYLAEVSRVLRDHLRHRDILVRMSGNTFAALLPATGFAAAALLAGRLQHAVDLFSLKLDDGGSARAGLSAGIAIYPQDGEELEDLLPRADANMYLNKKSRKNAPDRPATNVIPFPTQFPG
jgi:diguanylate cyclase (GGDEF)-like protein